MEAEFRNALAAIDDALADAPRRNGHAFSRALQSLAQIRGAIFARDGRRSEAARQRLARLNAMISIILAGHFPLGDAPWDEIRRVRDWLEEMSREPALAQEP